jgi:hypothetical protein
VLCLIAAASASTISLGTAQVSSVGGTASLNLTIDSLPTGLSGYDINITAADPAVAEITGVSFPSWAVLNDNSTVPTSNLRISAVDLNNQVQPGAANVTLATITLQGLSDGSTPLQITANEIDDDSGNMITPVIQPGSFAVTVPQPEGNISVTSTPSGAEISLDGVDTQNVTPYTLTSVTPGSHTVSVNLTGYEPASQSVSVTTGSTATADFTLAAIPQTGSISVSSAPSGAEISLDGTDTQEVTPYTLTSVTAGSHTVSVNLTGYEPASQSVSVTTGSTATASFTLVAIPPVTQTGSISVSSAPSGAEISLDGTDTQEVTPYTLTSVAAGSHTVSVNLTGYQPASQSVTVTTGSTATADFTLVAIPQTGSISVSSAPSGAEISLDGTDTQEVTPYTLTSVTAGSHTVSVNLTGYEPASQSVSVTTGSTATADFTLVAIPRTGSISVSSAPAGAEISLDGTDTQEVTPYTLTSVAAGSHTVSVNLTGYQPASQSVTVTTGSTATASFTLVSIPPVTQTGSISVSSAPTGAEISLDGTDTQEVTPYTLTSVTAGSHTVSVNLTGYEPASQTVSVSAGSTATASFTLVSIPPVTQTGSISVSSAPTGAEISLDGTDTGKETPYTLTSVTAGSHTVSVNLTGYEPASQTVSVSAGSTATASFTLVSIPPVTQTGSISVSSTPAGAEISLDGTDTGKVTPYTLTSVTAGSHTVSVNLTGYEPASQSVSVSAGSTATASFTLVSIPPVTQTGSISVSSTPAGAEISLDGTDTGKVTPYTLTSVTAGSHTVSGNLTGYKPASQTVTVTAGATAKVRLMLTRIRQQADLSIAEATSAATVTTGQPVTWTVTVTNLGPDAARDISVDYDRSRSSEPDARPDISAGSGRLTGDTWEIPGLASGQSAILTERVTYTTPGTKTESVRIVRSQPDDPNPANNAATASVTVTAQHDQKPRVSGISPSSGEAGSTIRVTVHGDNFDRGATVTLEGAHGNTLVPDHVSVDGRDTISFSLSIPRDAPEGSYDVVVTNADGQSGTLKGGFTVQSQRYPRR